MHGTDRIAAALGERYRVERELGRGGMGVVYLATDLQLDRRVAIKVLPPTMETEHAERFLREVRVLSALQHPNIVPLHDAGATGGLTWYSMPYIEGESLRERLAQGALLPRSAVQMLRDVASALDAAHAKGIVHRDVKPANILLVGDRALLADFGVARALLPSVGGDRTLTQAGTAIGSPDYMAPEQIASVPLDGRADQFSLACVAYEALTGRLPFGGESATPSSPRSPAGIAERFSGTPAPVPAGLALGNADTVLTHALAPDPAARYTTCSEFIAALDAALNQSASTPRTTVRRRRATVGGVAALVVAAGITVFALRGDDRSSNTPTRLLVLPIRNDALPRLEWLASGLTDELTSHLGHVPGLAVIARTTAAQLAGDSLPPSELSRKTGASHVITARIVPDADSMRVRVSAALVRTSDDTELWSETVPIDLADVRAGEALLARRVGEGLRGALGVGAVPGELAQSSPEVYELLLAAGGANVSVFVWTDERLRRADSLLRRAIAIDAQVSESHARLAMVRTPRLWNPLSPRNFEALLDSAKRPAVRALALDSMNVTANRAMAMIGLLDGQLDETRRRAERVLGIRHGDADALELLGTVALCAGQYDSARAQFAQALAGDPLNPDHAASLSTTEVVGFGRVAAARDLVARSVELWEDARMRTQAASWLITWRLLAGGSVAEARAAAALERARHPAWWAGESIFGGYGEVAWFLSDAEDWRWVDSIYARNPLRPVMGMLRAVAENRRGDARGFAPEARAALSNPDVAHALGMPHDRLVAWTHIVEGDTTAALSIVDGIDQRGCGRPTRAGREVPLVTYPAIARAWNGDTAGARRGLEAAFLTRPWPTREALRYHPILATVLGFPSPAAAR